MLLPSIWCRQDFQSSRWVMRAEKALALSFLTLGSPVSGFSWRAVRIFARGCPMCSSPRVSIAASTGSAAATACQASGP